MDIELLVDYDLELLPLTTETESYISGFNCGNQHIDKFLSLEGKNIEISKTFILTEKKSKKTIGFFSLCSDALLMKEDTYFHINPSIKISMFAIDVNFQGKREIVIDGKPMTYAHFLWDLCYSKIVETVENYVGATYITLYSTDRGYNFYKNICDMTWIGDPDEETEYKVVDELILTLDNERLKPMYREIFIE